MDASTSFIQDTFGADQSTMGGTMESSIETLNASACASIDLLKFNTPKKLERDEGELCYYSAE